MKFKIKWDYYNKNKTETNFISEWIKDDVLLEIAEDLEKTGRVKNMSFEDETGISWTKKEVKKVLQRLEQEPDEFLLYFDASYNKETDETGIGVVLYYKQGAEQYRERWNERVEGLKSNNEAEYCALHYAVKRLGEFPIAGKKVIIKGDSQGLLMQLRGEWPCYEENLNRWLDRIERLVKKLNFHPVYEPINRNDNKEADKLARQALKQVMIESKQKLGDEE
ncbi:reverse transcriptase-like protein [Caldifermentibacillus hisashii]|uniref:reverse transcriptase-like protein n=1 Tax=Caldifermentibacillus hisashii TaxID=996558 RepID=UPI0031FBB77E